MSKACLCCGKPITRQTCDYCGFVDIEVITTEADHFLRGEISKYKRALVSDITDISVISYRYKWNDSKSRLELDRKEELKLADGADCYPGIKWSRQSFGQMPTVKGITLELSYQFRGTKKKLSCRIPTVQCDDFWKVGLLIDQNLKLKIFLGTERNHAESTAFYLEYK